MDGAWRFRRYGDDGAVLRHGASASVGVVRFRRYGDGGARPALGSAPACTPEAVSVVSSSEESLSVLVVADSSADAWPGDDIAAVASLSRALSSTIPFLCCFAFVGAVQVSW